METDFPNSIDRIRADTAIGHALRIFSRLPTEIRSMISAHFAPTFSLSLLQVSETSCVLLNTIDRPRLDVIELGCNSPVETIDAKSISAWGNSYISSLSFNNAKGISVKSSKIKGVKFVIGHYGLRALSILYTDDSTSAWLGDPTNGPIGVLYFTDTSRLMILKDVRSPMQFSIIANPCRISNTSEFILMVAIQVLQQSPG